MLLSIIIVSYNTCDLTINAIKSAIKDIKNSALLKEKTEIILVDNSSEDESLPQISQLFKKTDPKLVKTKKIFNKKNLGFAQANNQGIEFSTGKYILLLNSDTIVQPQALETLVMSFENNPLHEETAHLPSDHLKTDRLGILAATLLNSDKTTQPQGGSLPTLYRVFNQMLFLDDLPVVGRFFPSTQDTGKNSHNLTKLPDYQITKLPNYQLTRLPNKGWVGGTAMMIRREVIDEIGVLDPNIFMYAEDVEFCMRARNHHWDIAVHPGAQIIHFGSASSSSENALLGEIKGFLYIWAKHKPYWQIPILKFILWLGIVLRIFLFSFISKDFKKVIVYKKALNLSSL